MEHFFCKLIPPRPSFVTDMSDSERAAMVAHGGYWDSMLERHVAIACGRVADPQGVWGFGLLAAESEEAANGLLAADPVILADIGMRWELLPVPQLAHIGQHGKGDPGM